MGKKETCQLHRHWLRWFCSSFVETQNWFNASVASRTRTHATRLRAQEKFHVYVATQQHVSVRLFSPRHISSFFCHATYLCSPRLVFRTRTEVLIKNARCYQWKEKKFQLPVFNFLIVSFFFSNSVTSIVSFPLLPPRSICQSVIALTALYNVASVLLKPFFRELVLDKFLLWKYTRAN